MKRFFVALAVATATFAGASPVAATGATCTYSAANHKVTVTLTGPVGVGVYRGADNTVTLGGYQCGSATVTNTDTIVVNGDAQSQYLYFSFAWGMLQPGFTNESGTSDEIEWTVNLGGGLDEVIVTGTDSVNRYVLGQDNSQLLTSRKINLNAGESTGIDGDLTISNVEKVNIYGKGGADVIRARGKAGTGPDPFTIPLLVHGDGGNDIIKGGDAQDRLYGDAGKDEVWGFGVGDFIHLDDGAPGDKGYGGAGIDAAYTDPGDTWQEN